MELRGCNVASRCSKVVRSNKPGRAIAPWILWDAQRWRDVIGRENNKVTSIDPAKMHC